MVIVEGQGTSQIIVKPIYAATGNYIKAYICHGGEIIRTIDNLGNIVSYGTTTPMIISSDCTLTSNLTCSYKSQLAYSLTIDSLCSFTITDTLLCTSNSRIIVRPGGKLIVNGGTLTSACDGEMWDGIIVEGNKNLRQTALAQGSVILTNATIENAREAISTRGADSVTMFAHTGGIVKATNTLFRNNCCCAEFLDYENHTSGGAVTNNTSFFTRCTFTINDDNLFADNNATFEKHVSLYKVRGVKFNGCAFRNEVTATTDTARGRAIRAIMAGFTAKRVCPADLNSLDPCFCEGTATDTITRCSFTGFYEAVHAANSNGSYDITIDNCDFAQNTTGVSLAAADNARVSFCDFNLDHTVNTNIGLSMKNCTGYKVESNNFYRTHFTSLTSVGINVDSSGTAENVIRLNDFSKLKYGCYAWNRNATVGVKVRGLQYTCNDFDSCRYSIYVRSAAKIRTMQGSATAGADNTFLHQVGSGSMGRSITIPADHDNVKYYHSSGTNHVPVGSSNYTLYSGAANSCSSTLCGIPSRDGESALAQYRAMAEELRALSDTIGNRADDPQDAETAALQMQLSDLSAAMGDLARTAIRTILSDTVVDMTLLKEWYGTIVETMCTSSLQQEQNTSIPVEAYQLAEVYSTEGDYAAANALLASLPQRFNPDEPSRNEYGNYLNLQRLRENVAGNWYRQTAGEIADLQQVAEYDNGRAARMAKEILCFFHHICYEDEPLFDLDGIVERGLRGDASHGDDVHIVSTPDADGLRLHPNPANTTLTVESDSPVRAITIYDLTGRTMMTVENCPSPATVNVVSLPRGIYLLRAVTDNGVKTARFVKN